MCTTHYFPSYLPQNMRGNIKGNIFVGNNEENCTRPHQMQSLPHKHHSLAVVCMWQTPIGNWQYCVGFFISSKLDSQNFGCPSFLVVLPTQYYQLPIARCLQHTHHSQTVVCMWQSLQLIWSCTVFFKITHQYVTFYVSPHIMW